VSRDEAIKIIEINLLLNGFSLVPLRSGIIKVIGLGKMRVRPVFRSSPTSINCPTVTDRHLPF